MNTDNGFAPIDEGALDFVEALPIETINLKTDKVIVGIYQERKSIGMVPIAPQYRQKGGPEEREAFVHVLLDTKTGNTFQVWDKAGLNYQIKMTGVQKGDVVRITRLVDVVNEDGTKFSQYKIEKGKKK